MQIVGWLCPAASSASIWDLLTENLTSDHIDAFIEQKKKAEYANASINRYLEVLTRVYTIGRKERVPPLIRITQKVEMLDESDNVREGFLSRRRQYIDVGHAARCRHQDG